jgi:hypothetical protein
VWYRFWYGNPEANARVNVGFTPAGTSPDLNLYTGSDPNSLVAQGGSPSRTTPTPRPTPTATPTPTTTPSLVGTPAGTGTGTATVTPTPSPTAADLGTDTLSRTVNLASAQWVYFTVVNDNDGTPLAYAGAANPVSMPPPTPSPTATSSPTATPTTTPVVQVAPAVPHDARYFVETCYRIDNDAIWGYFQAGIIDPAKITRSALENAASVAGMILSTEALVTDLQERHALAAASGAPDMYD